MCKFEFKNLDFLYTHKRIRVREYEDRKVQ